MIRVQCLFVRGLKNVTGTPTKPQPKTYQDMVSAHCLCVRGNMHVIGSPPQPQPHPKPVCTDELNLRAQMSQI